MIIKQITIAEAEVLLRKYGLDNNPLSFFCTHRQENGSWVLNVCDYRNLEGYTVAFACEVLQKDKDGFDGKQVERFNIMRSAL